MAIWGWGSLAASEARWWGSGGAQMADLAGSPQVGVWAGRLSLGLP